MHPRTRQAQQVLIPWLLPFHSSLSSEACKTCWCSLRKMLNDDNCCCVASKKTQTGQGATFTACSLQCMLATHLQCLRTLHTFQAVCPFGSLLLGMRALNIH